MRIEMTTKLARTKTVDETGTILEIRGTGLGGGRETTLAYVYHNHHTGDLHTLIRGMLTQSGLRRLKLLLVCVQRIVIPYRGRHSVAAAAAAVAATAAAAAATTADAYAAVAD